MSLLELVSEIQYDRMNDEALVRSRLAGIGNYLAGKTPALYVNSDECLNVDGKLQLRRKLRLENSCNMVDVEVILKKEDGTAVKDSNSIDEVLASVKVYLSQIFGPANKAVKYGFDHVQKKRKFFMCAGMIEADKVKIHKILGFGVVGVGGSFDY